MSDTCFKNTGNEKNQQIIEENPSECDSESLLGSILLSSSCINNTVTVPHPSSYLALSDCPTVTINDDNDVDYKTPTASPNASFDDDQPADISPSLRNLEPGYVSNLAQFWASQSRNKNKDLSSFFFATPSPPGGIAEKLLDENDSHLPNSDVSQLRETCFVQCEIIRDLEEDKAKMSTEIENLKSMNASLLEEKESMDENLKAKSNQIACLKESLNTTNDKLSKLLREDLEKNYRIIELEGFNEDLVDKNAALMKQIEELKTKLEEANRDLIEALQELSDVKEEVNKYEIDDATIKDTDLKNEIAMLDQDVNSLRDHIRASRSTKRGRKISTDGEIFKMKTISKSSKKRRKLDESKQANLTETTFSDLSSSSFDILEEQPSSSSKFGTLRSFMRSSLRSKKYKIKNDATGQGRRRKTSRVDECKSQ